MKRKILLIVFIIFTIIQIICVIDYNKEIKRLRFVNNTLYHVIVEQEKNYDEFEKIYFEDLGACYYLVESCQHAHDDNCYVNGGYNCE